MNAQLTFRHVFGLLATERVLAITMLIISVAFNVFLSYELVRSKSETELYKENRKLTMGEEAPTLFAHDRDGRETSVDFKSVHLPTVLYLESATCHWCQQNSANLEQLQRQSVGKYNLVRLLLEDAKQIDQNQGFDEDSNTRIMFHPTVESKLALDLTSTPTTILISIDGKIQKVWKGAYVTDKKNEVEYALGIKLPGLKESPNP